MERLERDATPGPWSLFFDDLRFCANDIQAKSCDGKSYVLAQMNRHFDKWKNDAAFIAASRQFIPAAIQELRKRDRALEIAKEALRDYKYHSSKTDCVTQYSEAAEALKQIKELLNEA